MGEFELEPGEVIVRVVRTHVFVLALRLLPFLVLAVLPWALDGFLSFIASTSPDAAKAYASFGFPGHLFALPPRHVAAPRLDRRIRRLHPLLPHDVDHHEHAHHRHQAVRLLQPPGLELHALPRAGHHDGHLRHPRHFPGLRPPFRRGRRARTRISPCRGLANPAGIRDTIMRQVASAHQNNSPFSNV